MQKRFKGNERKSVTIRARVKADTFAEIDSVRVQGETLSDFVRVAVEHELNSRYNDQALEQFIGEHLDE